MANTSSPARRINSKNALRRACLHALEPRVLFCLDHDAADPFGQLASQSGIGSLPEPAVNVIASFAMMAAGVAAPQTSNSLDSIAQLNSLPGAADTIFLDFDGANAMTWGTFSVPTTPAFDRDNDTTTFSNAELSEITAIFNRVAEYFSPFNINVTTVDPGTYTDGVALRALFGGTGAWLGASAGGVAYVGSFYNSAPNTVFAFTKNLGSAKSAADAAAHEIGHAFGLQHQSTYSGNTRTAEYNPGNSLRAPIMGVSYYSARGLWWTGQSTSAATQQNDLAVITNNTNGFGYRTDDHGNTAASPTALNVTDDAVSGSGVISTVSDVDVFAFSTLDGDVTLSVSVPTGGMLDATLQLVNSSGGIIATSDTANLGESITASLAEGDYMLIVSSKGAQGDIGQYTISGSIVNSPDYVAAPNGVVASGANGQVTVTWADRSYNETGFIVERSDDGGTTWNELGGVGEGITTFSDPDVTVGSTYKYRVFATGSAQNSGYSASATAGVAPAAATGLAVAAFSATQINLTWDDTTGETGYRVERSLNGTTWTSIATTAADAESYSSIGLSPGTRYYYRLVSLGSAGNSSPTAAADTFTVPLAPTTLAGAATTSSIALSWTNVAGETGYRVEKSTDGGENWETLATTAVNVVTLTDTGLTAGTTYRYRVFALNAGGASAATSLVRSTKTNAPSGLSATEVTATAAALQWTGVDGETGYRVELLKGTAFISAGTTSADDTDLAVPNLTPGTSYTFRVVAVNDAGASAASGTLVTLTIPAAPTLTATAISTAQITLTWTNVAGESGYQIEHSEDGGENWESLTSVSANVITYAHTSLDSDTAHSYRIRAVNATGNGAFSAEKATRTLLAAPTGFAAEVNSTTQITLSWDAVDGATGYKLERVAGTAVTVVANPAADATSQVITGLVAGTAYTYRLRARNDGGVSLPTTNVTATTIPAAPTVAGTATATNVALTWTNVAGETGYKVERSDDAGQTWEQIATTNANVAAYSDTSVDNDTTYSYRVRAHNAAGNGAYSAAIARTTLLPAPTGFARTGSTTTTISLSWNAVDGATGYRLQRQSGTTFVNVTTLTDTTYTHTSLTAGTGYVFRIAALGAGGFSAPAQLTAATKTVAPTTLTTTAPTATSIKLTWTNIAGETAYRIERSLDGETFTTLTTVAANIATYTNTGLSAGTYFYRVIAVNTAGDSAASPVASRTI